MRRKLLLTMLVMSIALGGCQNADPDTAAEEIEGAQESAISDFADNTDMTDATNPENTTDSNLAVDSDNAADQNITSENLPPLNMIDDNYRTTYEIFVYSFADSNGDGIGDLKGITQKLDYIYDGDDATDSDLGCNQIWVTPIMPSTTYHKYDVKDYKDIDPEFGTMADFEELVKESHSRGIRIILDLVLNHTSSQHPWFKEATRYLKDHPELEKIYVEGNAGENENKDGDNGTPIEELEKECPYLYYYNFTTEQKTGYEKVNGTNWYYEARFWSEMPDLNLDNGTVRSEISDITSFWLDKGVDGFRLDAVISYYTDNNEKNIEFMTWLNDIVKAQKEDAYIVGEAWTAGSTYASYYQSGIDSFFDFDFSGSEGMIASVARSKKSPLLYAKALSEAEKEYASYNEAYVDAPFYTNHDMARSAGYFTGKGSSDKVKMAGALNLLMGGNAYIYYGEELGMKGSGKDENKRAPMQWVSEDAANGTEGMCKGPSDMDKFEMTYPGLDEQEKDEYSIYNYYKKAIRLRNTYPVISRGVTQPVEVLSDDDIGAFVRYNNSVVSFDEKGESVAEDGSTRPVLDAYVDAVYGESALLILINNADEEKTVDLTTWSGICESPELAYELDTGDKKASLEGMKLTIPAYGIVVLK